MDREAVIIGKKIAIINLFVVLLLFTPLAMAKYSVEDNKPTEWDYLVVRYCIKAAVDSMKDSGYSDLNAIILERKVKKCAKKLGYLGKERYGI